MMTRSHIGLAILGVLVLGLIVANIGTPDSPSKSNEKQEKREGADQAQPPGPNPKPTLETATLYVAGSNGGPYKISWTVWTPKGSTLHEFRGTGVIKDEPTAYPIDLEGITSDRNEGYFLGQEDIDIEVTKTELWKGELVFVLEVNDTLVEC